MPCDAIQSTAGGLWWPRHDAAPRARRRPPKPRSPASRGRARATRAAGLRHCISPTTICARRSAQHEPTSQRSTTCAPGARASKARKQGEEGDAEDRRDADVDVDGVDEVPEPLDLLAAGMWPGGRDHVPETTSASGRGDERQGEPGRAERQPPCSAPRIQVSRPQDDGHRDRHAASESRKCAHDDQRVQLDEHGDPAQDPLRQHVKGSATAHEKSQRGRPARETRPTAAASVVRPTSKPATRLPNST